MEIKAKINLHLFDGEGAGGGEGTASAAPAQQAQPVAKGKNPLANVVYGKAPDEGSGKPAENGIPATEPETIVTSNTAEARKAEFDRMVKGEWKSEFDSRVQAAINARFKQDRTISERAERLDALAPVLEMLGNKYGIDANDAEALAKAVQEDNSYYEDEAAQKGVTVEQLKRIKALERENAEFRRMNEQREAQRRMDDTYSMWMQQGDECKRFYPTFDLRAEVTNAETGGRFMGLLQSGIDVKTAYEVIHKDDIIGGAMQYTAQAVQQKVVNDIRARGMRPAENGASGSGATTIRKTDPRTFTRKDREEISRRVMRGERIEL